MNVRPVFITGNLNLGGSTTFLLNLLSQLKAQGIDSRVIVLEPQNPMGEDFLAAGISLDIIDASPRIFEDVVGWGVKHTQKYKPTHVIACLGHKSFEILRYVPEGIPRFAVVQSDDQIVYDAIAHYAAYLTAAVGVSNAACRKLKEVEALKNLPAIYQPYGIPIQTSQEKRIPNMGKPIRILYFGRLDREQKRVDLFPQIYRELCLSGREFLWTIAGEGPYGGWLQKQFRDRMEGPKSVRLIGPVRYADIPNLLLEHDIMVLASDYEGLPLSLLEAMAHGVVPVVSDLESGIRDVVTDECGIRVAVDNVPGYSRALLELDKDRGKLARMAERSRKQVESEFSSQAMTARWLKMFQEIPASVNVSWARLVRIRRPEFFPRKFRFHPLLRGFRRMAVKLKAYWSSEGR